MKRAKATAASFIETLEKVITDLRQAEDDTVAGSFNAMLEEGPKPVL